MSHLASTWLRRVALFRSSATGTTQRHTLGAPILEGHVVRARGGRSPQNRYQSGGNLELGTAAVPTPMPVPIF
jgi:hypothetical protein